MKDRVLALAGVLQSCDLARQIAANGDAETTPLTACINSIFATDADNTLAVYGDIAALQRGLRLLLAHLEGDASRDPALARVAITVLHLERRFAARNDVIDQVRKGIEDVRRQSAHWGNTHPTVLTRLGELYAATISTLRPRILVQGNPVYLGQPAIVSEIRAVLLAAVRSALLWRQLGGSYWDLLFRRAAMSRAVREWLGDA